MSRRRFRKFRVKGEELRRFRVTGLGFRRFGVNCAWEVQS